MAKVRDKLSLAKARLRGLVRASGGKRSRPTGVILDSQSVNSDGHSGKVGYDAAKRLKGRKRHLLVDTPRLVLGVLVTAANVPEREGGHDLLGRVLGWFTWLRRKSLAGAWSGPELERQAQERRPNVQVDAIRSSDDADGFKVLPRLWGVEGTFGWLMRHRRLVRHDQHTKLGAETWIKIATIRAQLRRLA